MPRRRRTRLQELQAEAADRGFIVKTHSPGDGVTRYRFFDVKELKRRRLDPAKQNYFGPGDGTCTAFGIRRAYKYLYTGKCSRGQR